MSRRYQWSLLGACAGVYLIALGLITGVVSERFRFDGARAAILQQFDEAAQRARAHAMAWEQEVRKNTSAPPTASSPAATPRTATIDSTISWRTYLEMLDSALAQRDLARADHAWREAQAAAIRRRAWRPLVEVGDAAIRVSAIDSRRGPYVARAREAYLAALTRARAERSIDGVLQVAEAFHAIGDHRVVEQCLRVAEGLGADAASDDIVRLRTLTQQALDTRAAPRFEP
jgi:hypothetical protein